VPLSGFLNLPAVFFFKSIPDLFHSGSAFGIQPFRAFPSQSAEVPLGTPSLPDVHAISPVARKNLISVDFLTKWNLLCEKKGPKTSFHAVITPPNPSIWYCSNPKVFPKPRHGICASDPARRLFLLHPAIDNLLLSPEGLSIRPFFAVEAPQTSLQASCHFKPRLEMDIRLI